MVRAVARAGPINTELLHSDSQRELYPPLQMSDEGRIEAPQPCDAVNRGCVDGSVWNSDSQSLRSPTPPRLDGQMSALINFYDISRSASAAVFTEKLNLLACPHKSCRFVPRNPATADINQGRLQCCLQSLTVLWLTGSEPPQLLTPPMLAARQPLSSADQGRQLEEGRFLFRKIVFPLHFCHLNVKI